MQIPHPLPLRSTAFETDDLDELSLAQPERGRSYQQTQRGRTRADLRETSWGNAALLHERWSCGVRARCDRPPGYVGFAVVSWTEGDVRWCGRPLEPGAVLRVVEPWDISSTGRVELVCFAVGSDALRAEASALTGTEWTPPPGNHRVAEVGGAGLRARLLHTHEALVAANAEPAAFEAAEEELVGLAARLETGRLARAEPLARLSRRRAAVRRVEEFLDACGDDIPTIPALCAVAGVSERTLEYAFREQIGTTPVRFLKVRRLNRVRRGLLDAAPGESVTAIALRAGVCDLGRFAGEYRQLFGELPSETLRRSTGGARALRRAPIAEPVDLPVASSGERCWGEELR